MTDDVTSFAGGLSLDQQLGLLLHPIVDIEEDTDLDSSSGFGGPTFRELIEGRGVRFIALRMTPSPRATAIVLERLQGLARRTGSRLPIVFSTDPRHSFIDNALAAHSAQGVSQWPENIGLGAIGDEELVRKYGEIVRRDYLEMGIRMALHPQIDLATEPRWARQAQSFSSDSAETSRLLASFLAGLQGPRLGPTSVAATVKHFPGGGPQLDGEDPHFPYGREQVYPAGRFEEHLAPFRVAIEAGAGAIMPYYGMPVGLRLDGRQVEEVGFAFNRQIITGLLREELGYDGVVLTDFGLVTDVTVAGKPFPAKAWGVESLSPVERVGRLFAAGVDQLGGEGDVGLLQAAVERGLLAPERVAQSAARVIRLMSMLGLGDPQQSTLIGPPDVPRRGDVRLGREAQARSLVVLDNGPSDSETLPLAGSHRVHLFGVSDAALPAGWSPAEPAEADVAIVRISAPFEHRDQFFLESGMQQGTLDFPPEIVSHVLSLSESLPVVLVVHLSRPAILTPFVGHVAAIVADFGISDDVLMGVLSGRSPADGRLPFELPSSMRAVRDSSPDAANDTENPLFGVGFGIELSPR